MATSDVTPDKKPEEERLRSWHRGWVLSNYCIEEVIGKSLLFFEAQESGKLRPNHRVRWRGDCYLNDGASCNMDLSDGWFDAGDHLKLVFPMAWTITQIAWTMHSAADVLQQGSFDGKCNWHWALQTLEFGLRFLLKCTAQADAPVVQVGDTDADHQQCLRAEADNITPRTVYQLQPEQVGADMLALAAAAFAASSAALAHVPSFASLRAECLQRAIALYRHALDRPGCYSDSVPSCKATYASDNWQQYIFLAAAWLLYATGEPRYKADAERWQDAAHEKSSFADFSWRCVYFGACAVMLEQCWEERCATDCIGSCNIAVPARRVAYWHASVSCENIAPLKRLR